MANIIAGIWVTAVIIAAFFVPEVKDLSATPIAFFHVPMAISMFGCFFIAAACGVAWLVTKNERADALSYAFGEVGFVAGIITFLTGLLFARVNWNAYWTGDPQQVGVLGTLFTYAALLTLRGAVDDERKKRNFWAVYALFGLLVACFGSYVYSRIVPPGSSLHPNGTLRSPDYKVVFTFSILGYLFALSRIALLRAQLEQTASKLRELAWDF
ncbi:Cytochrome C assembly protein [Abditibacterium utsteinense]|uniref:Heme exporter protein C n=1 Tax=Abditibacterium utsteinense TaxID=1960156 RepID=A0A2S8SRT5_9BACT|nr:cytochrome c biogenesis protein CcsA [Abditibacterium utsteinense]PQV63486.1 Cytochrome C assembly protein [Abditibacterium utsteinense]